MPAWYLFFLYLNIKKGCEPLPARPCAVGHSLEGADLYDGLSRLHCAFGGHPMENYYCRISYGTSMKGGPVMHIFYRVCRPLHRTFVTLWA
jgi:hypothetical protein